MNDDQPFCQYEYSSGDVQNCCSSSEQPDFCPPECIQCCPPPTPLSNGNFVMECQGFDSNQSQLNYEQCCESQCYQPQAQQQDCQPCVTVCDPSNPCIERCNPCEPLGPCPMPCDDSCQPRNPCPPLETCSPMCSPYQRRRYIQPPRTQSCKPIINYQRPMIPMTTDTVYKKSFDFIDAKTAACCRLPPVRPSGQLRLPCGEFAKETVAKLSFQPHCCPERAKPIYPFSRFPVSQGPMQALTTQKHDFVPKFQYKRVKCVPRDNLHRACGCVERTTVQRMSFMAPDMCKFSKAQSCKPIICYKPPECKIH